MSGKQDPIIKARLFAYGLSGLIILGSLAVMVGFKLNYDAKIDILEQTLLSMQAQTLEILQAKEGEYNGTNNVVSLLSTNGILSVPEIAQKASAAVVGIKITAQVNTHMGRFGPQVFEQSSEGSGIICTSDGYIITNYHVVESFVKSIAGQIEVYLADGRSAIAEYVGGDEQNDLAVIKIELDNLPVAQFDPSGDLRAGEFAMAIGNPLGMDLAGTVTVGVISGIDRKVEMENVADSLIQTDAAINPGNSGGALVNEHGKVIGINTIKIASTGIEGIGFAIPVDYALPIVQSIIQYGYVKGRPATGISGTEINAITARFYNVQPGLLVTEVAKDSAAEAAGIQRNDIILKFDGKTVTSINGINNILKQHKVGDLITIKYYRSGQITSAELKLKEGK